MIPKIIHYCWFGKGEMPALAKMCINSWKKYLPDYELYLWSEDNFDINSNDYVKEAYQSRKFAYVTDYVRLYALYHVGGIYMDTDVEVIKSMDQFLHLPAFSGFETDKMIPTGLIASEKGGFWASKMLEYYTNRHFLSSDGTHEQITNVTVITNMMTDYGFIPNNSYQTCNGIFHLFPKDYFCPKSQLTLKIEKTENTCCIHHFAGSWLPQQAKLKRKIRKLIGSKIFLFMYKLKHNK